MQLITKFVQSNIDYQLNFQIRKLTEVEYDGLLERPHNTGLEVNVESEIVGYVILEIVLIHNLADEGISLQLCHFNAEVSSMSVVPKGCTFQRNFLKSQFFKSKQLSSYHLERNPSSYKE